MEKSMRLDVHGMTGIEAKRKVEAEIRKAPAYLDKIVVIHGCNHGTVLRDTIRRQLRSKRILDIIPTFANDGETTIYLKKN